MKNKKIEQIQKNEKSKNSKNTKKQKKINLKTKIPKSVFFILLFVVFLRTIQKLYFVGFCYFFTKNVAKQQKLRTYFLFFVVLQHC